jgi:hypothetical protein
VVGWDCWIGGDCWNVLDLWEFWHSARPHHCHIQDVHPWDYRIGRDYWIDPVQFWHCGYPSDCHSQGCTHSVGSTQSYGRGDVGVLATHRMCTHRTEGSGGTVGWFCSFGIAAAPALPFTGCAPTVCQQLRMPLPCPLTARPLMASWDCRIGWDCGIDPVTWQHGMFWQFGWLRRCHSQHVHPPRNYLGYRYDAGPFPF